jgi:hypothetical protein
MNIIGLGPDGDDGIGRGRGIPIRLPSKATSGNIGRPLSPSLITPGVGVGGANDRGGGGGGISLGPRPSGS